MHFYTYTTPIGLAEYCDRKLLLSKNQSCKSLNPVNPDSDNELKNESGEPKSTALFVG